MMFPQIMAGISLIVVLQYSWIYTSKPDEPLWIMTALAMFLVILMTWIIEGLVNGKLTKEDI